MKVSRGVEAVLDGKILDGEYGEGVAFQEDRGLYFLTNGAYQKGNYSACATQENFVLLYDDYVYCGLRFVLPLESGTVSSSIRNGIQCYRVSFSLSLAAGEHPVHKGAFLSNTYYFSSEDDSCIGFTGERIARSVNEMSTASKPLSTFSELYRENGVVSNGSVWNADFYCKNAAFSLEETSNGTLLVVEVKIPLEDVLLSVPSSDRSGVQALLNNPSEILCGSFSTSIDLDAASSVVTGVPSQLQIPDSANQETLHEWMKKDFEVPVSGIYIPQVIPIPLHWGKVPAAKDETSAVLQVEPPVTVNATSSTSHQALLKENSSAVKTQDVSPNEEAMEENDESIFESLPNPDSKLPENTEIIYDETDPSAQKSTAGPSLASSIFATVAGAFLFASIMVLCIYFRDSGKEGEKKKQDQHRHKKKNNPKKKDRRRD